MRLSSSAFKNGAWIPKKYTGEGEDTSPPLHWSGAPQGTLSFVLICEDIDAHPGAGRDYPFTHWLIYDLPGAVNTLPEGFSKKQEEFSRATGARHGRNSLGATDYSGPLPLLGGGAHRYIFRIFALDTKLAFPQAVDKAAVLEAMQGHVLDSAELTGVFERNLTIEAA